MVTKHASPQQDEIFVTASGRAKGLALQTARFVSVFLMALATGTVLTHVLQMPYKAELSGQTYVTIQNSIYQLYGPVVGAIEGFALLAALVLLLLLPRWETRFYLTLLGATCIAAMIGVWAAFINPINQEILTWTPEAFPADWQSLRDQWANLHAVRAVLAGIGLSSLIVVLLSKDKAL